MEGLNFVDLVKRLALGLIPMILSLSVHECSHAYAAYKLGDSTAKDAGRLTLNPQSHIDPWGTLIIPAMSVLMGGVAFIGWARPTPFRADRFRPGINRRFGAALVSAAGPLSNVGLALLSVATLAGLKAAGVPLLAGADEESLHPTPLTMLFYSMFTLNVALAFFNLLPIPPLDGHRFLPPMFDRLMKPLQRYGFAILMGIFLLLPGVATVIFYRPLDFVTAHLLGLFGI